MLLYHFIILYILKKNISFLSIVNIKFKIDFYLYHMVLFIFIFYFIPKNLKNLGKIIFLHVDMCLFIVSIYVYIYVSILSSPSMLSMLYILSTSSIPWISLKRCRFVTLFFFQLLYVSLYIYVQND